MKFLVFVSVLTTSLIIYAHSHKKDHVHKKVKAQVKENFDNKTEPEIAVIRELKEELSNEYKEKPEVVQKRKDRRKKSSKIGGK